MRKQVSSAMLFLCALVIACGAFAILFGPGQGRAQAIGPDKYKHAAGSAALSAGALLLIDHGHAPKPCQDRRELCAFAAALSVGLVKELLPRPWNSGFDMRDMAANAIGAAAGVWIHGLIIRPRFVGWASTF